MFTGYSGSQNAVIWQERLHDVAGFKNFKDVDLTNGHTFIFVYSVVRTTSFMTCSWYAIRKHIIRLPNACRCHSITILILCSCFFFSGNSHVIPNDQQCCSSSGFIMLCFLHIVGNWFTQWLCVWNLVQRWSNEFSWRLQVHAPYSWLYIPTGSLKKTIRWFCSQSFEVTQSQELSRLRTRISYLAWHN